MRTHNELLPRFTEWARQYGGLYTLKLGNATMAVITDRSITKSTLDKKSNIYSHRPSSYVAHDLITKGNHLLVMFYGEKWRTFRGLMHQHLTEHMVEREHLSVVNAEALQLVRDYMLFPEDHMLHPKRFSNSITNSIGACLSAAWPDPADPTWHSLWHPHSSPQGRVHEAFV
jgi:cytochrome P450 family 619